MINIIYVVFKKCNENDSLQEIVENSYYSLDYSNYECDIIETEIVDMDIDDGTLTVRVEISGDVDYDYIANNVMPELDYSFLIDENSDKEYEMELIDLLEDHP